VVVLVILVYGAAFVIWVLCVGNVIVPSTAREDFWLSSNHKIQLKLGVPIMLLRNINQSMGLCNVTRSIVTRLGDWVLEAEILTGSHIGKHICIPRIVLNAPASKWPFTLQHQHYPIHLNLLCTE